MTDHRKPDPLDEVIAAFRQMPVPDHPADDGLLARLLDHPASAVDPSPTTFRSIRRLLMHPIVRYATAAVVLLGILGWLVLTPSSSVALADVIETTAKHKLVRYKLKSVCDDKQNGRGEGVFTVYVDLKSPRLRVEGHCITLNGVLDSSSVMIQDNQKDLLLAMLAEKLILTEKDTKDKIQLMMIKSVKENGIAKKQADLRRVGQTPEDIKPFSDMRKDKPFLDHLREFQNHKNTTSTKAMLDGSETIKYRLEEDNKTALLWVDPKTKLPVRMEYEVIDATPRIARIKWIYTDFQWDPEVKDVEQLFSTTPPSDFTVVDHTKEPTRWK